MSSLRCPLCGAYVQIAGSTMCEACGQRETAGRRAPSTPSEIEAAAAADRAERLASALRLPVAIGFVFVLVLTGQALVREFAMVAIVPLCFLGILSLIAANQLIRLPRPRPVRSEARTTSLPASGVGRAIGNSLAFVATAAVLLVCGTIGLFLLVKVVCDVVLR